MIEFKIEDKTYAVPKFISVGNYSKIYKIKNLFSDDYFSAKMVSLLTGCPVEELLECDFEKVNFISAYLLSLFPLERPPFKDRIEIDGVHYGFITNWRNLTYAEYIDMDTISTKKEDDILNYLHILAAIMYRPIINERSYGDFDIEKYDVDSMKKRAELFKDKMDIKYLLGAQFFFINFARKYSALIQISSMKKLNLWSKIKMIWIMRKIIWAIVFRKRSVGLWSQTELLETIIRSTNKSIKAS